MSRPAPESRSGSELLRALACLAEPPTPEGGRIAALLGLGEIPDEAVWSDVFLFQLYPYASIYLGAEGMLGGEARDRVAGFWRALELTPPPEPDHLTMLLALYARLAEAETAAGSEHARRRWRHARHALLHEHLLSWLPLYLARFDDVDPFYARWASLLAAALAAEARGLASPTSLPLHLRVAPAMVDPRETDPREIAPRPGGSQDDRPRETAGERFLRALLSPARSGLILTRDDLARAARALGLGLRAGERAFALRSLLAQDRDATLAWLADEARRQAGEHRRLAGEARRDRSPAGEIADFWAARATAAGALLDTLRRDVAAGETTTAAPATRAASSTMDDVTAAAFSAD